jgi:hypothetical protein
MKPSIRCRRWSFEVKSSRRRSYLTRSENQISFWLIQDACFGVKWKVMRWLGSRKNAARVAILEDVRFSPIAEVVLGCLRTCGS